MEQQHQQQLGFNSAPPLVSLTPFTPSSKRRLSSSFIKPTPPVPAATPLSWVSLQGRLLHADEASSASAIKGGLLPDEAVAWELFSPIQRFLIVAVIGVAVAESKKNGIILQLKKSVAFRDQVLSSMQQKLDCLCEQLINVKDYSGIGGIEVFGSDKNKLVSCGCSLCDQHHNLFNKLEGNSFSKGNSGDEILQYKMSACNVVEQEERRMSDLSDWASSVTSAAETEIQLNNLAIEQDIYNLKRDCEDKDATIKDLTNLLHSSDVAGSKVVSLTRLRRPSFSASSSESPSIRVPPLTDNLLYDMDSTTSPSSSSDSDRAQSPVPKTPEIPPPSFDFHSTRHQKSLPTKLKQLPMLRPTKDNKHSKSRSVSPLKELSMNRKSDTFSSLKQRPLSSSGETKRNRRPNPHKDSTTTHKRWV
ncbi:hypothetical protein CsatB_030622 [Cannabis sativa]